MERKNTIGWNDNINKFYWKLQDHQGDSKNWASPKPRPEDFSSDSAERRIMEELLKRLFGERGGAALQPPADVGEGRKRINEEWTY